MLHDENLLEKKADTSFLPQLLTQNFFSFLKEATHEFDAEIRDVILIGRQERHCNILRHGRKALGFHLETEKIRLDTSWKVVESPACLLRPCIDIGDVDPSDEKRLACAFASKASGVQVDFDDGFCPTWDNVVSGHFNIYKLCRDPNIRHGPRLKLRPRSWNILEKNVLVNGSAVYGPFFDYLLHLFHNGKILAKQTGFIFLYLPKVESSLEARLWSRIFTWTEERLGLKPSTIRSIVLIETISAVFEMEEILYELRNHSAGLNCGLWDYSASFITRLGSLPHTPLFPDRLEYVSMSSEFLATYQALLVDICRRRGAPSTGGMYALTSSEEWTSVEMDAFIAKAVKAKCIDMQTGAVGALAYDQSLVAPLLELFSTSAQRSEPPDFIMKRDERILRQKLLHFESAHQSPTYFGFCRNVEVTYLFILSWLKKRGSFIHLGQVEDSATAEISRAQVWQQLRQRAELKIKNNNNRNHPDSEDSRWKPFANERIEASPTLVQFILNKLIEDQDSSLHDVILATHLTKDLFYEYDCPLFISTWLQQRGVLSTHWTSNL